MNSSFELGPFSWMGGLVVVAGILDSKEAFGH
jgi:hypothetical protein